MMAREQGGADVRALLAEIDRLARQMAELQRTVAVLERFQLRLRSGPLGAAVDGTYALSFPTRVKGPEGVAYVLVRESGGNLAVVAADGAAAGDWSDA